MPNKIFIYFLLYLIPLFSYSQIPGLTQFTINNGLPSNTVYDITQDSKGYIWLATDYGISKFDGLSFTNYTVNDGLPGNEILYFYKDNNDKIWLVDFNGKIGFIKDDVFYNEQNYPVLKKINLQLFPTDIYNDLNNNLWFLNNDGVYILDTINNVTFIKNNIRLNGNKSFLIESNKNKMHIVTYESKILTKNIIDSNATFEPINLDNFKPSKINNLRSKSALIVKEFDSISNILTNLINKDTKDINKNNGLFKIYNFNNKYWVTNTKNGAYIFDYQNNNLNKTRVLKTYQTTKAFEDKEGNVWIGSLSNGVTLFPNQNVSGIAFNSKLENDLHKVLIFDDLILTGNTMGEITVLDKHNLSKIYQINLNSSSIPDRIRGIQLINNEIFVLSDVNLYSLKNFKKNKIFNMFDTDFELAKLANFKDFTFSNNLIYTANAAGVSKIDYKNRKIEKIWHIRSTAINYCTNDSIWIGTTNGLFLKIKDTIKKYFLNSNFNNSIITDIKKNKNNIIIGSNSNGLGVLQNKKFIAYGRDQGLLSNYIKSIHIAKDSSIWVSTNFGLNQLVLNNDHFIEKISTYTISEGLYSNDVRSSYVDNNKVYVATSNGLNIIRLDQESAQIQNPKIYIKNFIVNNENLETKDSYILKPFENNIQFNYSGISFKSIGNISFKYRLKDTENEWIETKSTSIRYSSLPANNYTFEVKSVTKNGVSSLQPATLSFTIKQYYYKTWWFYSSLGILTLLIIFIYFNLKEKKFKQEQEIKENISNLKFKALNAQMNPHFINNLLSHILDLIENQKNELAAEVLSKFTKLVNLILKSTKSNLITLQEELTISKLYLELQSERFNHNFNYHINTDKISQDLSSILIPPMLLQPIIENAITHGIRQKIEKGEINIAFYIKYDNYMYCEITDNGIGYQESIKQKKTKGTEISLKNINERLQLINENSNEELLFIVNIKDEFGNLVGTKIILKIPLIIN